MNTMNKPNLQATLANAVPPEEQAVEIIPDELPHLTVVLPPSPAELAMSEEEQAVDPEEADEEADDEFYVVKKYEALATIDGMANIQPVFDNRLYASVNVDEEGNRAIVFCEKYRDGAFSPKMRVAQGDLYLLQMLNNDSMEPFVVKMKNHAAKFILGLSKDYLDKFNGDTPLDIAKTLEVLIRVRKQLPTYYARSMEQTPEQFYLEVVDHIKHLLVCDYHKAYYALEHSHICSIAKEMDMTAKALLDKLKEHGFLYLTQSSRGYQTNVRVSCKNIDQGLKEEVFEGKDSFTMWAYCIYKKEHIEKVLNEK